MKKVNFLTNLFFGSKKVIERIQPRIQVLEKEIQKINAMNNKVEAIVRLFQVISPIQDAGGFGQEILDLEKRNRSGKLNAQIEALGALQAHFHNAGRCEYGFNRTTKGEVVTAEKVFLGNVFGLWTKSAAYWLGEKERLEKTFRPDVSKNPENPATNWYLINDYQCGNFIKSHADGILKQIALLKAAA